MKTFKVALLLLLGGFLITSCEKENEEDDYRSNIINLQDYLYQETVNAECTVNSNNNSFYFSGQIFFAEKDTLYFRKDTWKENIHWAKCHYIMDGIKLRINSGTNDPSGQQSFHDQDFYLKYHKNGKFVLSTEKTDLEEPHNIVHHLVLTKK